MKKICVLIVCMTMCGAALFAQAGWPDIEKYAEFLMSKFVDAGTDWKRSRMEAANPEVAEKYASLQGNAEYFDEALELVLYTFYYVFSRNPAYSVPPEAEAILPRNNPHLVDRQLGAMVYKELTVTRFLGNSTAAKWEAVLKTITDRGNVTRAEVETFYRQNIGVLIAATVDAEFNRIAFMVNINSGMSYNCILTRSANNKYVLIYESYFGTNTKSKRELSDNSLELFLGTLSNSKDFTPSAINTVRAQAALIPAVALADTDQTNVVQGTVTKALTDFYLNPTTANYNTVKDIHALFMRRSWEYQDPFFDIIESSYSNSLIELSRPLASKVFSDAQQEQYSISSLTQTQIRALTVRR